jgi:hypothetical protein
VRRDIGVLIPQIFHVGKLPYNADKFAIVPLYDPHHTCTRSGSGFRPEIYGGT